MAAFHSELSRDGPGLLLRDILSGEDPQIEAFVKVVDHIGADVLVLADFDYDHGNVALRAMAERLEYPFILAMQPNRGRQSGLDLNGDGKFGRADDAWGYGEFAGQGGLAVLSRLPVGAPRDFSQMPWRALVGNIALDNTSVSHPLSTTAHWDVPVMLSDDRAVHILTWHGTSPVFDGPEDRNGRRNHDEIAFWLAYLDGALESPPPQSFVIAGFANLDPIDGDGRVEILHELLADKRLRDPKPVSEGAPLAAKHDKGANLTQTGQAEFDTVDWRDEPGPGNLRVDYVLPSRDLPVVGAGVFWPAPDALFGSEVMVASRHRLVWVDIDTGAVGER